MLHGKDALLNGDPAYRGQTQALKRHAPRDKDYTNTRAYHNKPYSERYKEINITKSRGRAFVEHLFLTLRRHWVFAKARFRGLAKDANRAFAMLALVKIDA